MKRDAADAVANAKRKKSSPAGAKRRGGCEAGLCLRYLQEYFQRARLLLQLRCCSKVETGRLASSVEAFCYLALPADQAFVDIVYVCCDFPHRIGCKGFQEYVSDR